jgi:dipeptide transport system ATP-binding protein
VHRGEVLGIVGESGSGKSVTALALMGLVPYPGRVAAARLSFDGRDLLRIDDAQRRRISGAEIAMIFQDPMRSLNPSFTVGWQLDEVLRLHSVLGRAERRQRCVELLEQVGIADPQRRLRAYPHQLSGGMSQRVMIAMAIACKPKLLIADEPTTALDVTIQAQIMALLLELQRSQGMALLLISHDLALVAGAAARVAVMYAGQLVEIARADRLFVQPRHPYTAALLAALPERASGRRLSALPGSVPGAFDARQGCLLNPRCPRAAPRCRAEAPALEGDLAHPVRCFFPLEAAPPRTALEPLEAAPTAPTTAPDTQPGEMP